MGQGSRSSRPDPGLGVVPATPPSVGVLLVLVALVLGVLAQAPPQDGALPLPVGRGAAAPPGAPGAAGPPVIPYDPLPR
ncbi:hypothetical protein GCM10010964_34220 [Caldovatus sediminis]|uniref:Uncharacterized protein n=1 Tax=Caldovatus sediminis TaxID=2041189 RepID=A0A8J3EDL7_9PROT|nr:hypothetical protein GCM10010964_34220 [Caldovatus sediminis]